MVMCNVYAPNEDDPGYFKEVIRVLEKFHNKDVVLLGGDFNMVMDPAIDRLDSQHNHHKSLIILEEYMSRCNLCDIWQLRNPEARRYTWFWDGKERNRISASRIDMMLISGEYSNCVTSCNISSGQNTDHALVQIELSLDTYVRGPGT